MSDAQNELWFPDLARMQLAENRTAKVGSLSRSSLFLWSCTGGEPERQAEIGTSKEELITFLREDGQYVRSQVAAGNLAVIPDFWRQLGMLDEKPWSHLGVSPQEAQSWIEAWAAQLFTELDGAHAKNAVRILLIAGYRDQDWNKILGHGASKQLAELAIMWAHQAYAYLRRDDLEPTEAIDKIGILLSEFTIIRYYREVVYGFDLLEPIYSNLEFTGEEVIERLQYLQNLERQQRNLS